MAEKYNYMIEKNNTLFAGYLLCTLQGDNHKPSLFQNLRIIRILEGKAELKIDKKTYKISDNDIVVLNNLVPRQFTKVLSEKITFDIFAFSPLVFKKENICLSLFYNKPNSFNPVISSATNDTADLHLLLDVLKNRFEKDSNSSCNHIVIANLITAIAANIIEINKLNGTDIADIKNDSLSIISTAIRYIFENMSEPINVSVLAKKTNVSREYFSRLFKQYVGYTPSSFITHCKIDNAINLIKSGEMGILEASLESGFNSSSGFYKAFHSIHKTSPRKYIDLSSEKL